MQHPDRPRLVEWILALRPDWDPGEIGGFLHLEGGYSNLNYRFRHGGDPFVLRVPGRPGAYTDRRIEAAFYRCAGDLSIAPVLAFDVDSGRMISRWVPGRLLADLRPAAAGMVAYLRELHDALAAVRLRCPAELARGYDPLALAREMLAGVAAPAWIHALAHGSQWRPLQPTVCHNDLNPWNLIEGTDGRWVTLDWEWVGLNDPLFDLVVLHQGLGLESHALTVMADMYLGHAVQAERLRNCLIAFWLREYAWAEAELAAGNRRAEIALQRDLGRQRLAELSGRT